MQIFEITAKKQLNEVSLGATAGAIGSAIGNKILTTAGQAAGLGGQDFATAVTGGTPQTGYAGQQAAAKAALPVIKQQAQAAQAAWKNQAAQMSKSAGGTFTQINPVQKHDALVKFVNDHLMSGSVTDYRNFPKNIDPKSFGGKGQLLAKQTVANIDALINSIVSMDPASTPAAQQLAAWQQLAGMTYNATNQAAFQAGGSGSQRRVAATADPRAGAAMAALNTDMAGLAQLNAMIKSKGGFKGQPTGDPYIDGLLKTARII